MPDRLALVTGGSRGIGAVIAATLRTDGWEVLAPTRSELDLLDPSSIDTYIAELGGVELGGLVLNAGINFPEPLDSLTHEAWDDLIQVNLNSVFRLAKAVVPAMAGRGFGRVVGLSSVYAARARVGRSAYSASKAAVSAFVKGLAVEYSAAGVLSNCVAPGFVDTELTRQNNDAVTIAKLLERVPIGRLADPQEIADVVSFLMGPKNGYITGQAIYVDGGFTCT